jgi:hypothetical protein
MLDQSPWRRWEGHTQLGPSAPDSGAWLHNGTGETRVFSVIQKSLRQILQVVGGFSPTPLKNEGLWVRQLRLWTSQYDGKVIKFHGSSHHQPDNLSYGTWATDVHSLGLPRLENVVILGLATGPHGAELAFRRQFWSYNKVTVVPCSHGTLQLGFMALHEAGRSQIHEGLLVGGDKVRLSLLFVDCSR